VLLAVLGGGGGSIKRRFALQGSYPTLEICVQYRESDWTFACRLMEENGIAYFFEHSDDATTLVLSDRPPSASAAIELRYRPAHATVRESDYGLTICALVLSQQLRPGKVTLHDWDFQKPSVPLQGEKTSGRASADSVEVYEHPAAQVTHEGAADRLAITTLAVRHEGLRTAGSQGRATSRSVSLVPGIALRILEHPHDALNDVYLVTSLDHSGAQPFETGEASQKDAYENVVTMIPLGVMFRPLHQTHRPVIHGVQTAIVVGPPGEEIHVDEHGRVKVQFHWDRQGKGDASSSCWVRVSQGWAGAGWGTVFLPRVGHEVVVAFLEGDPDRPMIVGRVYHGANVAPYKLPDDKTKSTIKSNSSPGGEGSNELRFEDKKGAEEIYQHAQKDLRVAVEHDAVHTVGHDETRIITHDRVEEIQHDHTETVKNDATLTVEHNRSVSVTENETHTVTKDRTVHVVANHVETVDGNQTVTSKGDQTLSVQANQTVTVDKSQTVTVHGDASVTVDGGQTVLVKGAGSVEWQGDGKETFGGALTRTVKSDQRDTVQGKWAIKVQAGVTLECGASKVSVEPGGKIVIEGMQIEVKCAGPLKVQGTVVSVKADGVVQVQAPVVELKAEAGVKVKGAMIALDGSVVTLG
jgi:type VI secretion system secreted protein VgrG